MDSLTQAVLGAGIGVAVAGRKVGPRKAALAGAVLGTVPDLDVFYSHGDAVSDFVLHRGLTHSLLIHALVAPIFGEILMRIMAGLRERRWTAYLMVFLCFSTHALLDAMTVYGTQLLWPISRHPFGVGSLFIIDPIYTIPLVVLAVWALLQGSWSQAMGRAAVTVFVLTTGYLGWSVLAQSVALDRIQAALAQAGIEPERVLVTPTPFNTLFWRGIAIDGDRYVNVYTPLMGGEGAIRMHAHARLPDASFCLDAIPSGSAVAAFSKGFYKLTVDADDRLRIADLRMGVTPAYVFDFAVAQRDAGGSFEPIEPVRVRGERGAPGDIDWLLANLGGDPEIRPAESAATLDPQATSVARLRSPSDVPAGNAC
jgi:inner membrane protein